MLKASATCARRVRLHCPSPLAVLTLINLPASLFVPGPFSAVSIKLHSALDIRHTRRSGFSGIGPGFWSRDGHREYKVSITTNFTQSCTRTDSFSCSSGLCVIKTDMRSILLLSLIVSLLAVTVDSLTDPSVPDMFLPFGTDKGDSVVPVGDDISSPAVNIPAGFPFLKGRYTTVYVSIKV